MHGGEAEDGNLARNHTHSSSFLEDIYTSAGRVFSRSPWSDMSTHHTVEARERERLIVQKDENNQQIGISITIAPSPPPSSAASSSFEISARSHSHLPSRRPRSYHPSQSLNTVRCFMTTPFGLLACLLVTLFWFYLMWKPIFEAHTRTVQAKRPPVVDNVRTKQTMRA